MDWNGEVSYLAFRGPLTIAGHPLMSEKGTEPDIELRCANVAELPEADVRKCGRAAWNS